MYKKVITATEKITELSRLETLTNSLLKKDRITRKLFELKNSHVATTIYAEWDYYLKKHPIALLEEKDPPRRGTIVPAAKKAELKELETAKLLPEEQIKVLIEKPGLLNYPYFKITLELDHGKEFYILAPVTNNDWLTLELAMVKISDIKRTKMILLELNNLATTQQINNVQRPPIKSPAKKKKEPVKKKNKIKEKDNFYLKAKEEERLVKIKAIADPQIAKLNKETKNAIQRIKEQALEQEKELKSILRKKQAELKDLEKDTAYKIAEINKKAAEDKKELILKTSSEEAKIRKEAKQEVDSQ